MKKILSLVIIAMLFCSAKALEAKEIGVFVGSHSLNLKEVNKVLDSTVNAEYGINLRFQEDRMVYGVALESRSCLDYETRIDISYLREKTSDLFSTVSDDPDMPNIKLEKEVEIKLDLMTMPIFLTRVYQRVSRGRLIPYFGVGIGIVFTNWSNSWNDKHFTSAPLAGQVVAGIEYDIIGAKYTSLDLSRRESIVLEARYIVSSKARIHEKEFKTNIDWSGFSYRAGLKIRF